MNDIAKVVLVAAALLPWQDAAAQLFKCTDAAGKISYTSMKCSDLGLKEAGEVRDRLQVSPPYQPAAPATQPPRAAKAESNEKPAATEDPAAKSDRRCFTTRNAKGATVTRCNDKPDEE